MLKTKINEFKNINEEPDFPFIGEVKYDTDYKFIVLFLNKTTSVTLYNDIPHTDSYFRFYKVGEINKGLDISKFSKFDGEVILSNGNFDVKQNL